MLHHSWTQLAFFCCKFIWCSRHSCTHWPDPKVDIPSKRVHAFWTYMVDPQDAGRRAEACAHLAIRVRWNPRRFIPVILLFALVDLRWWQNPQVFVAQILQIPRFLVPWEHHVWPFLAISDLHPSLTTIMNHYHQPWLLTMMNHLYEPLWTLMNHQQYPLVN